MIIRRLSPALILLAAVLPAAAMEIPMERGTSKSGRKGMVVGFVDMDRIYKDFPETQKARKEYQEQAGKMKAVLSDKEAELADLREQLSVLKAAAQEVSVSASSAAVRASTEAAGAAIAAAIPGQIADNVAEKEHLLSDQENALSQARREAAAALTDFERRRASQIFGKLYKSLMQLADEKGVDVVLDKSALLYGQGGLDLTESLSRRVRGLPDEENP